MRCDFLRTFGLGRDGRFLLALRCITARGLVYSVSGRQPPAAWRHTRCLRYPPSHCTNHVSLNRTTLTEYTSRRDKGLGVSG